MIRIQTEDFNVGKEYDLLRKQLSGDGAIVFFVGLVRDFNQSSPVSLINLEHYPGMTEKALADICIEARSRWCLGQIRLIHRIGVIEAKEQIVFVGVSAKHRKSAFEATEYIMDFLKAKVPLWKQEATQQGTHWVQPKSSDTDALVRWE